MGSLLFNETLNAKWWMGVVLIFAGVAILNRSHSEKKKKEL